MSFYTNIEQYGSNILVRGYRDGVQYKEKVPFKPKLYIETNKPTKFKSIHGQPLEEIEFKSLNDAWDFTKRYKDVDNFKFYGMEKWVYQYTSEVFWKDIEYDMNKIKILYFDIETDSEGGFANVDKADKMITAITMQLGNQMICMGYKDYVSPNPKTKYLKFTDEKALLNSFIEIFSKYNPDIISGWYSEGYDIPYIINRCRQIVGIERTKDLSPWRMIKDRIIPKPFGKEIKSYDIVGIAHLDYIEVYKKMSPNKPESYKLDQIAYDELKTRKLDYSEYGSLAKLYRENPQKFMEYAEKDTALLPALEKKLKFIELFALIAYYSKTNYVDVFFNTRVWDSLIFNYLKKKNTIIDSKSETDTKKIEGGHVKEPIPGLYGWNVSDDGESLYPLAGIITGNISPDTFVEKKEIDIHEIISSGNPYKNYLLENNYSMAGNGSVFRRDKKGFLPEMMEELFGMRKDYKNKMLEADRQANTEKDKTEKERLTDLKDYYNSYQLILKILLNSAFGALAAPGFRYCHSNFGEAITMNGQLILQWGEKTYNVFMNKVMNTEDVDYVIYADTDSLYTNFQPLVDRIISKIGDDKTKIVDFIDKFNKEKVQPLLKESFENLAKEMNYSANRINFKREKISESAIFIKKKRYILNVWDKEGTRYDKPKIDVTGAESVRSSTPEAVRKALKECYDIILNGDNAAILEFKADFKEKFKNLPVEEIALPKQANNLLQYSNKNSIYGFKCPLHVRGSLLYNHYLKDNGIDDIYEEIKEGEKIKYVYLKLPNPIRENTIAFPSVLPKELELHEYIDYNKMFQKGFIDPLESILEIVKWNKEDYNSLDNYF